MTGHEAAALFQRGVGALQAGDARSARGLLSTITQAGLADTATWLALAQACLMLRDTAAAGQALDQALAREPRNLTALMAKADLLHLQGDGRGAAAFYAAVLRHGQADPALPDAFQPMLARARAASEKLALAFEARLRADLGCSGEPARSARFEQSLELLSGRRQRYFQNPKIYCFPELPQIQFYDRALFPWMDALEASTDAIRAELEAVLREGRDIDPYVRRDPSRPGTAGGGMVDNPDWSAYYLWRNGEPVAEHVARCPQTMAALEAVPLTRMPGRSPSILFSVLRPGARIPPHSGLVNTRLICHLPLVVPPGCGFRVGNETRAWVEGRAWAFDDTIEHEAWNDSDQTRVILLFEIWRPELTDAERDWVCRLFEAID
ncbi:MAG: aspartyl/asparaginyl beta-hydroxylase domain-containing protein, partial [Aquabacterium sp.]